MKKMVVTNTMDRGFALFHLEHQKANEKACIAVGLQLLNFCAKGSPNSPIKPPIWSGYLRGSGSVFVNDKFIKATERINNEGTPLKSLSVGVDNKNQTVISVVYNAAYAARMHEGFWSPGQKSTKDGNTGRKWIEIHLNKDAADLMFLYGTILKKELWK
jgi:hypothetical protein